MESRPDRRPLILMATVFAAAIVTFSQPRLAQWREYHQMADTRTIFGVPNALNVLSNVPFAAVGVLGLWRLLRAQRHDPNRGAYAVLFSGVVLTAFGSTYYHLQPDNFRLVWDRIPMTVAFMGLLAVVIGEHLGRTGAKRLLIPLVAAGASSVLYWYWTELRGAGDLRPYGLVQFGSLLLIAVVLVLYPRRGWEYVCAGLLAYGASKLCEMYDAPILNVTRVVSGHTLKHLLAATGAGCIAAMLYARRPERIPDPAPRIPSR